jgi:hypothetical protein
MNCSNLHQCRYSECMATLVSDRYGAGDSGGGDAALLSALRAGSRDAIENSNGGNGGGNSNGGSNKPDKPGKGG